MEAMVSLPIKNCTAWKGLLHLLVVLEARLPVGV